MDQVPPQWDLERQKAEGEVAIRMFLEQEKSDHQKQEAERRLSRAAPEAVQRAIPSIPLPEGF
jgi:hypothetical protein